MNLDAIASRLEQRIVRAQKLAPADDVRIFRLRARLEGILSLRDQLLRNERLARTAAEGTHLEAHIFPSPPPAPDRPTLCIMADFGNATYAWLRPAGEGPPAVGPPIAELGWCAEEFRFAQELRPELERWATEFECQSTQKDFDWAKWNARGISLAKRLKQLAGDSYLVEYHYPYEDPTIRFSHESPPVLDIK